ncbi:MAG TPA: Gfo/Idh/MocA family oxidoreductase [Acidimicrobiales bacterium]|nr:Gfo/Idh/MocA family oxidoreductase [Acidimicrobiales bacterium]
MPPIRMGILGAARIAPAAVLRPAHHVGEVEVTAIAARQPERAAAYGAKHAIPRVLAGYEELVADPDIDAVYIPLPNGLHGKWAKAALAAGKHVLCEKPFTANAAEALEVKEVGEAHPDLVLMEAFHYRYHPLFARARQLLDEGAIGQVRHIDASFCFPLPMRNDIRWQLDLAGGALMDAGCYAVHMLRHLAGAEPEVTSATARIMSPGVDRMMRAHYRFPDGRSGRTTCSMLSSHLLQIGFRVEGDAGRLQVFNPLGPHIYHRLTLHGPSGRRVEHVVKRPTYEFQLEAFADAINRGVPPLTGPADSLANMSVIDAVYSAAGLEARRPTPG